MILVMMKTVQKGLCMWSIFEEQTLVKEREDALLYHENGRLRISEYWAEISDMETQR